MNFTHLLILLFLWSGSSSSLSEKSPYERFGISAEAGDNVNVRYLVADREEILKLKTKGSAWRGLLDAAEKPLTSNLADQNDLSPAFAVASGLAWVRTGQPQYRSRVINALQKLPGTEFQDEPRPARTLSLGRQLAGWIIAADLVEYREPEFLDWVKELRTSHIGNHGRWVTLTQTHENSASNWGAFAGSSRIAASLYIGDMEDVSHAANVLRGKLGDRDAWPTLSQPPWEGGFQPTAAFDATWACNYPKWLPVNAGCESDKEFLDGALVEDISRSRTSWPNDPDRTGFGYSWEVLQGIVLQAHLLSRHGYPDVWEWSDRALLRSIQFLERAGGFEDEHFHPINHWVTGIIDAVYGTDYTVEDGRVYGRSFGYTDWLGPALTTTEVQVRTAPAGDR